MHECQTVLLLFYYLFITQAERPGFKFQLSFFTFFFLVQSQIAVRIYNACVMSRETEHPLRVW